MEARHIAREPFRARGRGRESAPRVAPTLPPAREEFRGGLLGQGTLPSWKGGRRGLAHPSAAPARRAAPLTRAIAPIGA